MSFLVTDGLETESVDIPLSLVLTAFVSLAYAMSLCLSIGFLDTRLWIGTDVEPTLSLALSLDRRLVTLRLNSEEGIEETSC
jgi:hypothetical protein